MEILAVENLSFAYPNAGANTLSDVTFTAERGEFIVLCGPTGCGKTTLLRLLKREIAPRGRRSGTIRVCGGDQDALSPRESAAKVGFVMQSPEMQIVTDKVWHELAFGLENLGLSSDVIRRRVAETAAFFGIEDLFERSVSELSGGQKQLLALASVTVMEPDILLLDEPTARLDPIAASAFMGMLEKINRELSVTVILSEHRLEGIVDRCDRLLVLGEGKVRSFGTPRQVIAELADDPSFLAGMPAAVRLHSAIRDKLDDAPCPLTVAAGRRMLESNFAGNARIIIGEPSGEPTTVEPALELSDLRFRYGRDLPDVLRGVDLRVPVGEILCILGGNGSGKSTLLSAIAGLIRPYAGKVRYFGKNAKDYRGVAGNAGQSLYNGTLSMLPQDVQTAFLASAVREELTAIGGVPSDFPYDFAPLLDLHPYDLSGGQQQMLALAIALSSKPRLLLLDEPEKGLDAAARTDLTALLQTLKAQGMTLIIVTHDPEFAAVCADRCALFFGGEIVCEGSPREFFSGGSFYTTAANRMTRGLYPGVVTVDEAVSLCLSDERRADR